jgi:hypothetical protein
MPKPLARTASPIRSVAPDNPDWSRFGQPAAPIGVAHLTKGQFYTDFGLTGGGGPGV